MRCTSFFRRRLDACRAARFRASDSGVAAISAESIILIIRRVRNLILHSSVSFSVRTRGSHQRSLERRIIHKFSSLHESVDRAPLSNSQPFHHYTRSCRTCLVRKFITGHHQQPKGPTAICKSISLALISNPSAWAIQATKPVYWGHQFKGAWVRKWRQSRKQLNDVNPVNRRDCRE